MSIKSLLQLILLSLIFIIIGGIYYLYFYSGPIKKGNTGYNNLNDTVKSFSADQEFLEENNNLENKNLVNKNQDAERIKSTENTNNSKSKINSIEKINNYKDKENSSKLKNLTKEIEYVATNKNGDIYKVLAKYGKTHVDNYNILKLEDVKGTITSKERSKIYISSDFANYNYANQDSEFYSNVVIKYDNKEIKCDNLDLIIDDDIAIAYNNVLIKSEDRYMKAEMISFNIVSKEININSDNKVTIETN